ncbi:PD40 domain-containing protein [candidate division TA06 bacterium]|nr:PD40 domain-containing protein [candidate division TA06 bacterium]
MKKYIVLSFFLLSFTILSCFQTSAHFKENTESSLRQLTFEGESGEAYFSPDGKSLIFQSIRGDHPYYQIYTMNVDGSDQKMVSTGEGKTTCSYFSPDEKKIIFSSTHHAVGQASSLVNGKEEEEKTGGSGQEQEAGNGEKKKKYTWDFDSNFEIYMADPDGSNLKRLTHSEGYDAEGTFSPDGSKIVFTSNRDGDLELYTMNPDGSEPKRITHSKGYDGGAFFSPDGKEIVFRAFREGHGSAQIFLIHADPPGGWAKGETGSGGTHEVQLTDTTGINWGPFFHPDGKTIIFSSNMADPENFDLYTIQIDGKGLKRLTTDPGFDALPVFSPDGKKIVFTSNRSGKSNLYMMDYNP